MGRLRPPHASPAALSSTSMRIARRASAALLLLLLATPAAAQSASSCTPLGQATFVRDNLQELYLWYRDLPDLDPADAASPWWC